MSGVAPKPLGLRARQNLLSIVSVLRVMFLFSALLCEILRTYRVVARIFRNILACRVCGAVFLLHLRARKLSPLPFVFLRLFCLDVALQQYSTI